MAAVKRIVPALLSFAAAAAVFAAEPHRATPLHQLLERFGHLQAQQREPAVPAVSALPAEGDAVRTFDLTARSFEFVVTPSPFVVSQGDTVTLRVSVPASDSASSGHGFFLERYIEDFVPIPRGQSRSFTFTATTPGTFTYFCTNASCGSGHTSMVGTFTVLAAAPPPTITSISPASGPAAGGTTVTISGTNFATGATVRFGSTAATTVTVAGSTTITAVAPPQAPGKVVVSVTNPDGAQATFDGFTYVGTAPLRRRAARS